LLGAAVDRQEVYEVKNKDDDDEGDENAYEERQGHLKAPG